MDRRAQILDTALDCFVQKGFHGTSTREICRAAGISSGLIFHYFDSKEAVFEALVRQAFESMTPDSGAGLADPLGYLSGFVTSVVTMLRDDPASARLFLFAQQAQAQRTVTPVVDELFRTHDLTTAFLPIVMAGQSAGTVREGDPRALTIALLSALQGLAEELALTPDAPLPDPQWYIDLLTGQGRS